MKRKYLQYNDEYEEVERKQIKKRRVFQYELTKITPQSDNMFFFQYSKCVKFLENDSYRKPNAGMFIMKVNNFEMDVTIPVFESLNITKMASFLGKAVKLVSKEAGMVVNAVTPKVEDTSSIFGEKMLMFRMFLFKVPDHNNPSQYCLFTVDNNREGVFFDYNSYSKVIQNPENLLYECSLSLPTSVPRQYNIRLEKPFILKPYESVCVYTVMLVDQTVGSKAVNPSLGFVHHVKYDVEIC